MKNNLFNTGYTENGMPTYTTSSNSIIDLFSMGGSLRKRSNNDIKFMIYSALKEDFDLGYKLIHYLRDAREGIGERRLYRLALEVLLDIYGSIGDINYIGEYGRWDDLVSVIKYIREKNPDNAKRILLYLRKNLKSIIEDKTKVELFAKWMPRKGKEAKIIRNLLNLTPEAYRKFLSPNTHVVEQKMSAKKWNDIEFEKVPALAMLRYSKAFNKHAPENYSLYKKLLIKNPSLGNIKVNTPHDIYRQLKYSSDIDYATIAWNNLPEFFDSSENRVLPVIDVSGSMESLVSGNISAMDISISLGMYLSERLKGIYKNCYITFSENPYMNQINEFDNIYQKIESIRGSRWGYSTNIEAVFNLILNKAKDFNIEESEMPTHVIILTDMEFNVSTNRNSDNVIQMIKRQYNDAGYNMPKIIFWNLNAKNNNIPFKKNDSGVIMVSGFSVNSIKDIFQFMNFDSILDYIKHILNNERYNKIKFLEY